MDRLKVNELVAMFGGLLLGACLFANWYSVVSPLARLAGSTGVGTHSGWEAHAILRWALLVMAIAPFVLAYIVARDHQLTWAPGELTAVLSIVAFGLLLYVGVIDRPGEPPGQIELSWGWYTALLGTAFMLAGSALRSGETERRRKPPGTV
jgi:archaellum biogenesis protein FlaJ (TadC family)